MPVDDEHLKKVGYLKAVKPQAQANTQEKSSIEIEATQGGTQESPTQAATQATLDEEASTEVCEGVKHFAVVVNQDWVARTVKNDDDKKFADRQRAAVHAHSGGGHNNSRDNSNSREWGGQR